MSTPTSKRAVAELALYYGSESDEDTASVCRDGVDCNAHGATANDKSLGKGGYFHVNASRANDSRRGAGKKRHVFVVKCLVGRWGKASSKLVLPPSLDPRQPFGKHYDSYVDDVESPKTFIIFDKSQVCPKYLITYTMIAR